MGQETVKHGLSRRQLIGAAAGSAAGAALAGRFGSQAAAQGRGRGRGGGTEMPAHLPEHTIGLQWFRMRNVVPGDATEEQRLEWFGALQATGNHRLELFGSNNFGFPNNSEGRQQAAAYAADFDMEIFAHHNGPSSGQGSDPSEGQINSWIGLINDYGLDSLGTGSGWSGPNTVENWIAQADNANRIGQAYQAGTATVAGVPGARWYGHNHQGEWEVVPPGNAEWSGRSFIEIALELQDFNYAYAQFDLGWARGGLPSNEAWLDQATHWSNEKQDGHVKVPTYHVKGQTADGDEVDVLQPTDVLSEPAFDVSDTWWKRLFESLEDPSAHTYFWERDGDTDPDGVNTSIPRFQSILYDTELDRSLVGAPGNVRPPAQFSPPAHDKWYMVRGSDTGRWVRTRGKPFSFQWTRNGLAIPGATRRKYNVEPADAGKVIRCSVSASNGNGATPEPTENPALVVSTP